MKYYYDIEQGTEEWLALRLGKFTASKFKDLFMGKETAGYQNAIFNTASEYVFKTPAEESFTNYWMQRGTELEPIAAEAYEVETLTPLTEIGFVEYNEFIGCSPDRLIGKDGLLEIKCPSPKVHLQYLTKNSLPKEYYYQVYGQMFVTGRKWCDFVSFHPDMKMLTVRVKMTGEITNVFKNKFDEALTELDKTIIHLKNYLK